MDFDDTEGLTYSYIDSNTKQEVVTTLNPNQIGYCVLYLEKKEKTDSDIQEDSKLNKPIFSSGILIRPFNIFDSTTWTPLSSLKQTLLEIFKGSVIPQELLGSQNIYFRSLMEGRLQNFSFYDPSSQNYKRRTGHYIIAYPSLNGFTYGRIVAIHENNLLEVVNTTGNIELLKQAKIEVAESLNNIQSDLVIEKNPGLRNVVSNDPKDLKIQTNDEFIRDVNEVNQNYIDQEVQKVMDKLRKNTNSTQNYIHQIKQIQNIQSMNIEIEFYDPTIFEFSYRSNFDSDTSYEKLLDNYKSKGIIKLVSEDKILIQYTKSSNPTLLHTIAEIDVRNLAKFQIFDNPTLDQLNQ